MHKEDRDLALLTIITYGERHQWRKIQEELGELSVAISHFLDGRDGAMNEVRTELADVQRVINQGWIMADEDAVFREYIRKGERQKQRIEEKQRELCGTK